MGTTQMFAALSENPDFFRERMKIYIAIAPVLKLANSQQPVMLKGHEAVNDAVDLMKIAGPRIMNEP